MRTALIVTLLVLAVPARADFELYKVIHETYGTRGEIYSVAVKYGRPCDAAGAALSISGELESYLISAEAGMPLALHGVDYLPTKEEVVALKQAALSWRTRAEQQKLQCK